MADALIVAVTTSMVASVIIGGMRYLRRTKSATVAENNARGADTASAQGALTAALAAYEKRTAYDEPAPDEMLGAWEAELGERIDELETAFASLTSRLTRMGSLEGDAAEVLKGISRGVGRSRATGSLSEEQSQLLQRITSRARTTDRAIGAGA